MTSSRYFCRCQVLVGRDLYEIFHRSSGQMIGLGDPLLTTLIFQILLFILLVITLKKLNIFKCFFFIFEYILMVYTSEAKKSSVRFHPSFRSVFENFISNQGLWNGAH